MEEMLCDHCKKPITKKNDLVVTTKFLFFLLKKYHRKCFSDLIKMKTLTSGFIRENPINSMRHTLLLALSTFLIWALAFFMFSLQESVALQIFAILLIIIPLPGVFIRLYSYCKIEKQFRD
jgi:hypothetical protein